MIVLRFFSGVFGVAAVAIGPAFVSDLFEPEERGNAMAIYTISPILGPCLGPLYAGWIIVGFGEKKWPWIFYVSTMLGALVSIIGFFTLQETNTPVLVERKAARKRQETGDARWHTKFTTQNSLRQEVIQGIFRPCIFLVTQPVVLVVCIFQGLMFGCQYLFLSSFSRLFGEEYGQSPGISGLHYFSMILAFVLSGIVGGKWVDWQYNRLKERNNGVGEPEHKLPLLISTGILMPAGLLLYGWTAQYHLHWILPDLGMFILSWGTRFTLFLCPLYLADAVSVYTASASSAGIMFRGAFAFTFPLFAPSMYDHLGYGWGNSILAMITFVVGITAPLLLIRYGASLRERSSAAREGTRLMS